MNAVDTNVLIYARDRRNTVRQKIALDLIIGACQELGVEKLYSEDLPGHVVESPQIINPFI